jgi:hypothetical protein
MLYSGNKGGQVTVFIIIALVIIAGIGVYIYVRSTQQPTAPAQELSPVFSYYQSCIEAETKLALDIAGTQAGYTSLPAYEGPSAYAPFSSQMNFLGFNVPYWFYVSGNGITKEQVPTKAIVERQISSFLESDLQRKCTFDDFYSKGWQINIDKPQVSIKINDNSVDVIVNAMTSASSENASSTKSSYEISVDSAFGDLLNKALALYNKQLEEAFLENYSLDVIYNYAPVDGVEIGCSPKIWKSLDVENTIKQGLEANIGVLKFGQASAYSNVQIDMGNVYARTLYSKDWPSNLEIAGADGEIMKSDSVGQQAGLGVLGFCYQPYHFVYSLMHPVMFQLTEGSEVFQFPVVVVIKGNNVRQPFEGTVYDESLDADLCQYSTQDVTVKLFDVSLRPVDGIVSYNCFDQSCSLGETSNGIVNGKMPACLNGFIDVNAEGYAPAHVMFSSHSTSEAEIILDKSYEVKVSLLVDGKNLKGNAMISFEGKQSKTVALPQNSETELSEGFYNVSIYVYGNTSIAIPASTSRQCVTVTSTGIAGFFGQTKEQCYDITLPETKIDSALIGGGRGEVYLLPEMLQKERLQFSVQSLPIPKSLDELQTNYALFETQGVDIL